MPTFMEQVRVLANPDVPMEPDKRAILADLEPRALRMQETLRQRVSDAQRDGAVDEHAVERVRKALTAWESNDQVRSDVAAADDASGDLVRLLGKLEAYWDAYRAALALDRAAKPARGIVGEWRRLRPAGGDGLIHCVSPRGTRVDIHPLDVHGWSRIITIGLTSAEPTSFVLKGLELGRQCEVLVESMTGARECTVSAANMAEVVAALVARKEHDAFPNEPLGEHAEIKDGYVVVSPCGGSCRFRATRPFETIMDYRLGDARPLHVKVRLRREVTARLAMSAGRDKLLVVSGLPVTFRWTAAVSMAVACLDQRFGRGIPPVPRSSRHED